MATISDMPIPSVTEMSIGELIDLMRDIRASRRTKKHRTKRERTKQKNATAKTYTKLKSLSEEKRNALIDKMLAELEE